MSITIYGPKNGGRLIKVAIAAEYTGVELKYAEFKYGVTNKTPEYLAKFPLGKLPAAETPYGPLTESGAIARYVAGVRPEAGLLGSSFYQQALVSQWTDFTSTELESLFAGWVGPAAFNNGEFNQKAYDEAKNNFTRYITYIDGHLVANTFLTGDTITLADIALLATLKFFTEVVTESQMSNYPSVQRWVNTLMAQKEFKAVIPQLAWAKTEKLAPGNPAASGSAAAAPAAEKKAEAKPEPAAEKKAEAAPAAEKKPEKAEKGKKGKAAAEEPAAEEPAAAPEAAATPEPEAKPEAKPEPKGKKGSKGKAEPKAEAKPEPKAEKKAEAAPTPAPASPKPKQAEQPKSAKKEPKQEQPKTPKGSAKAEQPKGKKGGKGK